MPLWDKANKCLVLLRSLKVITIVLVGTSFKFIVVGANQNMNASLYVSIHIVCSMNQLHL
jgi:hypothetical protein